MLIHRRRSGQPQGVAKLRSELGFTSFMTASSGADLVTGAPVIYGNGGGIDAKNNERTFIADGSNRKYYTIADSSVLSTTEATVVLIGEWTSGMGGAFGEMSGKDSQRIGFHPNAGQHGTVFDFGGTSGANRISVTSPAVSRGCWVCTAGPRGLEIWLNGVLLASNAGVPTRSAGTAPWGIQQNSYVYDVSNGRYSSLGYAPRQLAKEMCQLISADPWGTLFVQRRRSVVVGPLSSRRRVVFWG